MITADELDHRISVEGVEPVVQSVLARFDVAPEDERGELVTALESACGVDFGHDKGKWESWARTLSDGGLDRFGPLPSGERASLPADGKLVAGIMEEITTHLQPKAADEAPPEGAASSSPKLADDELISSAPFHQGYRVLGGVVIYEKLGQGGMGAVYRGRHLRLDIDVAVKVMDPLAGARVFRSREFVRRFVREAQMAAGVQHANLIRVYDVNAESGIHFIIMDFVDGESAHGRLRRKGTLSEVEAVEIGLSAAAGLAEAHRLGVVHRDVKPDNIMIDKEGRVRVTDLGLAKAAAEDSESNSSLITQTRSAMGTPSYMSPEQFVAARDVGPAADVWSLGVTLYQLVTGELPWVGSSIFVLADKVRNDELPDPTSERPGLSDGLRRILAKATAKDPAARYADCGEMARDLKEHLAGMSGAAIGTLADVSAGSLKEAEVTMTPPPPGTISLIAERILAGTPRVDTQSTWPGGAQVTAIVTAVVGTAALIVAIVVLMFPSAKAPAEPPGALVESLGAAADAARAEAAFREAVDAADAAEERDDLDAAVAHLQTALRFHDDSELRARLAALQKRIVCRRLLDEATVHEDAGELIEARSAYERARDVSVGNLRELALSGMARVNRRIAVEDAVHALQRAADAGRWRRAWELALKAKEDGIADPRVDELQRHTIAALAPKSALEGPLGIGLVLMRGGSFMMGRDDGAEDERPAHGVTVSAFYIGRCEVTRAQYDAFRKGMAVASKAASEAARQPVVSVTWSEANAFCRYLKELDPSGARYRLPTEAEWEYAARGSQNRAFPWGEDHVGAQNANLEGDADGHAHLAPVGSYPAGQSPQGVQDLVGNAAEWCADWYGPYAAGELTDPTGPDVGEKRVVKGSAFAYGAAMWSFPAMRGVSLPENRMDTIGFRIVRELTLEETEFLGLAEGNGE